MAKRDKRDGSLLSLLSRASAFGALLAVFVIVTSCSETDGTPPTQETLGLRLCMGDLDCGAGRHCNDAKLCAIECVTSKDCVTKLTDPNGPNELQCSPCGRCVAKGTRDSRCLSAVDQPCSNNDECTVALGPTYQCNDTGFCAKTCTGDEACREVGRGWGCGPKSLCVRSCVYDGDCYFHGYRYGCRLPAGVDPVANADSATPVSGECISQGAIPGMKPPTPSDPPAAKYQGIWGMLLTSASRIDGVPILTRLNAVNIQHLLVKITYDGANLSIQEKWCLNEVRNFQENDRPPFNLFEVKIPDRNVDSVRIFTNHALNVPAMLPGATFDTDELIDLRGAKLANPKTDTLPNYKDPTNQWDQDRDGKPGMTANVIGALTGELYQTQRFVAVLHARVIDERKMEGLISGTPDAAVLGGTQKDLINDAVTTAHPQADRTYFRAMRLEEEASCLDVIRLAGTEGSYIEFTPHVDGIRPEE
jgi:hypothetical protein